MDEKIYCGSGRIIESKFGQIPKVSFSKDDINKMVQYMKDNNLDWINLEMKEKKEKQSGKPTHYLQVDTWKPNTQQQPEAIAQPESENLPF
jgi:hypothetical protein